MGKLNTVALKWGSGTLSMLRWCGLFYALLLAAFVALYLAIWGILSATGWGLASLGIENSLSDPIVALEATSLAIMELARELVVMGSAFIATLGAGYLLFHRQREEKAKEHKELMEMLAEIERNTRRN